jgi:hypothetical protein
MFASFCSNFVGVLWQSSRAIVRAEVGLRGIGCRYPTPLVTFGFSKLRKDKLALSRPSPPPQSPALITALLSERSDIRETAFGALQRDERSHLHNLCKGSHAPSGHQDTGRSWISVWLKWWATITACSWTHTHTHPGLVLKVEIGSTLARSNRWKEEF